MIGPANRRVGRLVDLPLLALLAVAALLLAACSSDGDAGASAPQVDRTGATAPGGGPDPSERITDFAECGGGLWCSTLTVPVDWGDPEGPAIDLAVAARPATDPERREGLLVLHPGGPGASGVDLVRSAPALGGMDELNETFDLISWDPRGVGDSTRLTCDADAVDRFRRLDPEPDDPGEQAALDEAAAAVARSCAAGAPELATHLGTDQTIQDVDALRAAFGDEQLSWLGFSYGTYLGQVYAEAYPERVRAMVLDGVVDPAVGLAGMLGGQAVGFDGMLTGDLADAYDRVLARVEEAPVPDGRGGTVGPAELATAAFTAVYDDVFAAQLPEALDEAAAGDGGDLAALAETYWAFGDYGAYVGTLCADLEHPVGGEEARAMADDLAARAPRAGAAVANEVLPCAYWAGAEPPAAEPIRAVGAPTILVVGNTGDVATPVVQAEQVAAALDDAVLVVHEGTGHTSFGSSRCVRDVVVRYLVDLAVPPAGTVCAD